MAWPANPFTPNQPINPQYFAGRLQEVERVNAALNQTRHGKTQHVLLTGERGIGKTSLAFYERFVAEQPNEILKTDFHFAAAYYTVERGQSLADVCRGLVSKLLASVDLGIAQLCLEKLKRLTLHFSIHVPGVGEINVAPARAEDVRTRLYADFEKAIEEAWDELKSTHNGILLIIDELHNLNSFDGVGSFFKVVSEAWAADGYRQAMFTVIGLPQISTNISEDDRSAPRVFSYVELTRMTEEESLVILRKCLSDTGKRIEDDAARLIAFRSGGFPYFLHQLGYDAFEVDSDGVINTLDVNLGLIKSLVQFDRMFFGKMYKSIEGKQKQKIVDELANAFNAPRTAVELERKLRIKNIHQYLKPLESEGIVEKLHAGFRLSTDLLAIYVRLFKTAPRNFKQKALHEAQTQAPASVTIDEEPPSKPNN